MASLTTEAAALALREFDRRQPRWPKGTPLGGQWRRLSDIGLPDDLKLYDDHIAAKLRTSRFAVKAAPGESQMGGRIPTWSVTVKPRGLRAARQDGGSYDDQDYDPELARVNGDGDIVPTERNGWTREVPFRRQRGVMFRGMSGAELFEALDRGEFRTRGEYNVADSQRDTTSWSEDPLQARNYGGGFSPWHLAPTPDEPGYIVAVRRTSGRNMSMYSSEIDSPPVSTDQIIGVVEIRPYSMSHGHFRLDPIDSYAPGLGYNLTGSSPTAAYVYRLVRPDEMRESGGQGVYRDGMSLIAEAMAIGGRSYEDYSLGGRAGAMVWGPKPDDLYRDDLRAQAVALALREVGEPAGRAAAPVPKELAEAARRVAISDAAAEGRRARMPKGSPDANGDGRGDGGQFAAEQFLAAFKLLNGAPGIKPAEAAAALRREERPNREPLYPSDAEIVRALRDSYKVLRAFRAAGKTVVPPAPEKKQPAAPGKPRKRRTGAPKIQIPALTPLELAAAVMASGYTRDRQAGSHATFKRAGSPPITIPMHAADLGKGLMLKILKDAGIGRADLFESAWELAESIIKVPTKSGNEFHDTANGRFADEDGIPSRLKDYTARAVQALDITPEQFGKIFEGIKLPDGYSADVSARKPSGDEARVRAVAVIRDKSGAQAGEMVRTLHADANGNLVIHDDLSRIEEPHRGKGLASAFNEQADEAYRKMGVQRIELTAGYTHGPLVWALSGFLFRPPKKYKNGKFQDYAGETEDFTYEGVKAAHWLMEGRLRDIDWLWLKAPNFPNAKRQKLAEDRREKARKAWEQLKPKIASERDLERDDLSGFYSMPWEIAMAGRELSWWQDKDGFPVEPGTPGAEEWWLGKRILMGGSGVAGDGASWDGVRFL